MKRRAVKIKSVGTSKNKGVLYDPKVVDICIRVFKEEGFRFE
jgi:hypothetical protein